MAAISQTTLSNAFSWMKMLEFRLRFHWSLLLRVQLTIIQHWFRYWLGASQATSHYLNQWWLVYWRIYASLGLNELTMKHEHHRLWATAVEDHSAVNYLISTIRFPILVRWYFLLYQATHPSCPIKFIRQESHATDHHPWKSLWITGSINLTHVPWLLIKDILLRWYPLSRSFITNTELGLPCIHQYVIHSMTLHWSYRSLMPSHQYATSLEIISIDDNMCNILQHGIRTNLKLGISACY